MPSSRPAPADSLREWCERKPADHVDLGSAGFTLVVPDSPFTKGDFPGHPFRGNQYTTADGYIADESGKPREVFHGTARVFDRFQTPDGFPGGFAFTSEVEVAERYAQRDAAMLEYQGKKGEPRIIRARIRAKAPLVIPAERPDPDGTDIATWQNRIDELHALGHDSAIQIKPGIATSRGEVTALEIHAYDPGQIEIVESKPLRTQITKGDYEGHPFRGNQYTDAAGGGGDWRDQDTDMRVYARNADDEDSHLNAEEYLRGFAGGLRDRGMIDAAKAMTRAAEAHHAAMVTHHNSDDSGEKALASSKASAATREAFEDYDAAQAAVDEGVRGDVDKRVRASAADLGYKGQIVTTSKEHEFELGGRRRFAAGTCDSDGLITIYAKRCAGMDDDDLRTLLAHEIGHAEYDAAHKELGLEHGRMRSWRKGGARKIDGEKVYWSYRDALSSKEAPGDDAGEARYAWADRHSIERVDGTLTSMGREVYAKKYPTSWALREMVPAQPGDLGGEPIGRLSRRLSQEDGVTAYSQDWWHEVESGKATFAQAEHETFAEIRALVRSGKKLEDVAKPTWQAYYKLMVKLGTERLKKQGKET